MSKVDDWKMFSQHMIDNHIGPTERKYDAGDIGYLDLVSMIRNEWAVAYCFVNIIKYAIRSISRHAKGAEPEKIAHYAERIWHYSKK